MKSICRIMLCNYTCQTSSEEMMTIYNHILVIHRLFYSIGRDARRYLDESRTVAKLLNAKLAKSFYKWRTDQIIQPLKDWYTQMNILEITLLQQN